MSDSPTASFESKLLTSPFASNVNHLVQVDLQNPFLTTKLSTEDFSDINLNNPINEKFQNLSDSNKENAEANIDLNSLSSKNKLIISALLSQLKSLKLSHQNLTTELLVESNNQQLQSKRIERLTQKLDQKERKIAELTLKSCKLENTIKDDNIKIKQIDGELRKFRNNYFNQHQKELFSSTSPTKRPFLVQRLVFEEDLNHPTVLVELDSKVWRGLQSISKNATLSFKDIKTATKAQHNSSLPTSPVTKVKANTNLKKSTSSPVMSLNKQLFASSPISDFSKIKSKIDTGLKHSKSNSALSPSNNKSESTLRPSPSSNNFKSAYNKENQTSLTVLINIIEEQTRLLDRFYNFGDNSNTELYNNKDCNYSENDFNIEKTFVESINFDEKFKRLNEERIKIAREWVKIGEKRTELNAKESVLELEKMNFWKLKNYELFDRLGKLVDSESENFTKKVTQLESFISGSGSSSPSHERPLEISVTEQEVEATKDEISNNAIKKIYVEEEIKKKIVELGVVDCENYNVKNLNFKDNSEDSISSISIVNDEVDDESLENNNVNNLRHNTLKEGNFSREDHTLPNLVNCEVTSESINNSISDSIHGVDYLNKNNTENLSGDLVDELAFNDSLDLSNININLGQEENITELDSKKENTDYNEGLNSKAENLKDILKEVGLNSNEVLNNLEEKNSMDANGQNVVENFIVESETPEKEEPDFEKVTLINLNSVEEESNHVIKKSSEWKFKVKENTKPKKKVQFNPVVRMMYFEKDYNSNNLEFSDDDFDFDSNF
ncbi:hypothetical protein HDU92_007700 [Lobulomyces angularis]|nr:hypothetical protein HDU92_007700 [Lobulomyces angularis]